MNRNASKNTYEQGDMFRVNRADVGKLPLMSGGSAACRNQSDVILMISVPGLITNVR